MDPGIPSARDDGARYPKKVSRRIREGAEANSTCTLVFLTLSSIRGGCDFGLVSLSSADEASSLQHGAAAACHYRTRAVDPAA